MTSERTSEERDKRVGREIYARSVAFSQLPVHSEDYFKTNAREFFWFVLPEIR